jgi:hypothetical protein
VVNTYDVLATLNVVVPALVTLILNHDTPVSNVALATMPIACDKVDVPAANVTDDGVMVMREDEEVNVTVSGPPLGDAVITTLALL